MNKDTTGFDMGDDMEPRWRKVATEGDGVYRMTMSVEVEEAEKVLKLLTTNTAPTEGKETVRGLKTFAPGHSLRDCHLVRTLQKSTITKVGTWSSEDKLWSMTLGIAHNQSGQESVQLFYIVSCELESRSSIISLEGNVSAWVGKQKEVNRWGRRAAGPLLRWHGQELRTKARVHFTDVHYAIVEPLDKYTMTSALEDCTAKGQDRCLFDCDINAQVRIQPRYDLASMGRALQESADLVSQIIDIGGLSLRDVQNLALTSKAMRVSVAEETRHRLRKVLAPYFPGSLDQLSAVLRKNHAIIGGSTMLSILKPGDWEPDDLDIVLPESSAGELEKYLDSQGYVKDPEREQNIPYVYEIQRGHSTPFRWSCFRKGEEKIDLCYTDYYSSPLSHILCYHSTPVMNFFDGDAVHCLFPEQTFAGLYLNNTYYPGGTTRMENALRKLKQRGFVEDGNVSDWLDSDRWSYDLSLNELPTIWRQVVTVEAK